MRGPGGREDRVSKEKMPRDEMGLFPVHFFVVGAMGSFPLRIFGRE